MPPNRPDEGELASFRIYELTLAPIQGNFDVAHPIETAPIINTAPRSWASYRGKRQHPILEPPEIVLS